VLSRELTVDGRGVRWRDLSRATEDDAIIQFDIQLASFSLCPIRTTARKREEYRAVRPRLTLVIGVLAISLGACGAPGLTLPPAQA
jgi:hypothetical protein